MDAINTLKPAKLYNAYKQARIEYYKDLGIKKPMFLAGWLNRARSFPDLEEEA